MYSFKNRCISIYVLYIYTYGSHSNFNSAKFRLTHYTPKVGNTILSSFLFRSLLYPSRVTHLEEKGQQEEPWFDTLAARYPSGILSSGSMDGNMMENIMGKKTWEMMPIWWEKPMGNGLMVKLNGSMDWFSRENLQETPFPITQFYGEFHDPNM